MNNFYGRFKSLLLPIVALAAVAGIVQDLLLPLAKFGIKVGVAILVVGTVITLIKEQSRLGQKIKNITNNWKYPLVVSMYVLGISVISLSVVTEQSGGEKGVLASNFSALETVQASLLGIEKEIAETKRLVEENIQVTQSVKDDTDQIKSDTNNIVGVTSETLNNTNVIIQNTQKNAYERLAARGIQPNDKVGFVRSVKDSNWAEFQELMQLYQSANFNVVKNVQMPDAVLEHDYNTDKEKAMVFNAPSNVLLIDVLLMLKTDVKRLEHIIDLFDLDVRKLVSPVATAYGRNKYSQVPFEQFMRVITHPQIKVAAGEDIDFSLISHQLARDKNLHDKRGSYNLIHYVATLNYQEYLDPLLQRGIDVNAKTHAGYTPLALALENGHLDMAEMLLERGATFEEGSSISIEIALIKALAHNNPRPSDGSTERYYPVKENPYFNFLAKHGVNQYPREIQSSVVKIYAAYLEEEKVTYSSRKLSEGATTYKDYIDWLKGQKVI